MLFYTGLTRSADGILIEQKSNIPERSGVLSELHAQVDEIESTLLAGCLSEVGGILNRGWKLKKTMTDRISNVTIDDMYRAAIDAGATGGKIAGAGGGGFLMLYCPPEAQQRVRAALSGLKELPFSLERDGTKVILNARR